MQSGHTGPFLAWIWGWVLDFRASGPSSRPLYTRHAGPCSSRTKKRPGVAGRRWEAPLRATAQLWAAPHGDSWHSCQGVCKPRARDKEALSGSTGPTNPAGSMVPTTSPPSLGAGLPDPATPPARDHDPQNRDLSSLGQWDK